MHSHTHTGRERGRGEGREGERERGREGERERGREGERERRPGRLKREKSNFIPLSPSLLLGRPDGFSFKIWEAGTSVNSDFNSWKANVSKFH
jgi:hypothetical protein